MTATPAWPPRSAPRLFVDQPLSEGGALRIEGNQAHYLLNVMRLPEGAAVKLFDDISGEYLGRVSARGKRDLMIDIEGQTRPREAVPDFWLCAAPIKKPRFDFLAEKPVSWASHASYRCSPSARWSTRSRTTDCAAR